MRIQRASRTGLGIMVNRSVAIAAIIALLVAASGLWTRAESPAHSRTGSEKPADSAPVFEPGQGRVEDWLRLRREKAQHLRREKAKPVDRFFLWLEDNGLNEEQLNIHYKRFYPEFGSLSPAAGASFGTRYWRADLGQTRLDLRAAAAASVRGYQQFDFQFGRIKDANLAFALQPAPQGEIFQSPPPGPLEEKAFFFFDTRYRRLPQERFFGTGSGSRLGDRTNFRLRQASYEGVAGYRWNKNLSATVRAGLLQFDLGPGTDRRFPNTETAFQNS